MDAYKLPSLRLSSRVTNELRVRRCLNPNKCGAWWQKAGSKPRKRTKCQQTPLHQGSAPARRRKQALPMRCPAGHTPGSTWSIHYGYCRTSLDWHPSLCTVGVQTTGAHKTAGTPKPFGTLMFADVYRSPTRPQRQWLYLRPEAQQGLTDRALEYAVGVAINGVYSPAKADRKGRMVLARTSITTATAALP